MAGRKSSIDEEDLHAPTILQDAYALENGAWWACKWRTSLNLVYTDEHERARSRRARTRRACTPSRRRWKPPHAPRRRGRRCAHAFKSKTGARADCRASGSSSGDGEPPRSQGIALGGGLGEARRRQRQRGQRRRRSGAVAAPPSAARLAVPELAATARPGGRRSRCHAHHSTPKASSRARRRRPATHAWSSTSFVGSGGGRRRLMSWPALLAQRSRLPAQLKDVAAQRRWLRSPRSRAALAVLLGAPDREPSRMLARGNAASTARDAPHFTAKDHGAVVRRPEWRRARPNGRPARAISSCMAKSAAAAALARHHGIAISTTPNAGRAVPTSSCPARRRPRPACTTLQLTRERRLPTSTSWCHRSRLQEVAQARQKPAAQRARLERTRAADGKVAPKLREEAPSRPRSPCAARGRACRRRPSSAAGASAEARTQPAACAAVSAWHALSARWPSPVRLRVAMRNPIRQTHLAPVCTSRRTVLRRDLRRRPSAVSGGRRCSVEALSRYARSVRGCCCSCAVALMRRCHCRLAGLPCRASRAAVVQRRCSACARTNGELARAGARRGQGSPDERWYRIHGVEPQL